MTPKEYIKYSEECDRAIDALENMRWMAYEDASLAEVPERLRPAVYTDIVVGKIIWYPNEDGRKWAIVEEVRSDGFLFKDIGYDKYVVYCLNDAFVELD